MKKKKIEKTLKLKKNVISKFQLQKLTGGSQLGGCQTREGCNSRPDYGDPFKECEDNTI